MSTGNYNSNSLEHMNLGQPCPYNTETFVNGITNGAEWYSVIKTTNMLKQTVTIEQGCYKFPLASHSTLLHTLIHSYIHTYVPYIRTYSCSPIKL